MSDISKEEFLRAGHEVIEWIGEYLENIRDYPVLTRTQPGDLVRSLPESGPEQGESMDALLSDFRNLVVPSVTHWNHPRFHGYFANSASGPGILAEALAAALNMNHMVWRSGPAAAELEQVALGWLRDWMGLPKDWFGVIYDTASVSTFHALVCAREAVCPEARTEGARPGLVVYASEHAHSSVEKGAIAAGFGQKYVRKIPTDAEFRMRPDLLAAAVEADVASGLRPCCVVPTVGTTSTTSIDPVPQIAAVARQYGMWMHVDASFAGPAAILPECRHLLDGSEHADSFVVNPHKWLFTPVDISVFYTRKPEILRRAFSLVPEYLKTGEDRVAVNYMDYGVPLGRRFRALKLWFVLRRFGRQGISAILRNHIAWIQELATTIARDERFEVVAPVPLSLICFRLRGSDESNRALLERVNATGRAFLSHTVLNDRFVLRLSAGNLRMTREDLDTTWQTVVRCAAAAAGQSD